MLGRLLYTSNIADIFLNRMSTTEQEPDNQLREIEAVALKAICTAVNADVAGIALTEFEESDPAIAPS